MHEKAKQKDNANFFQKTLILLLGILEFCPKENLIYHVAVFWQFSVHPFGSDCILFVGDVVK